MVPLVLPQRFAIGLLVDYVFKKQVSFAFIFCECQFLGKHAVHREFCSKHLIDAVA